MKKNVIPPIFKTIPAYQDKDGKWHRTEVELRPFYKKDYNILGKGFVLISKRVKELDKTFSLVYIAINEMIKTFGNSCIITYEQIIEKSNIKYRNNISKAIKFLKENKFISVLKYRDGVKSHCRYSLINKVGEIAVPKAENFKEFSSTAEAIYYSICSGDDTTKKISNSLKMHVNVIRKYVKILIEAGYVCKKKESLWLAKFKIPVGNGTEKFDSGMLYIINEWNNRDNSVVTDKWEGLSFVKVSRFDLLRIKNSIGNYNYKLIFLAFLEKDKFYNENIIDEYIDYEINFDSIKNKEINLEMILSGRLFINIIKYIKNRLEIDTEKEVDEKIDIKINGKKEKKTKVVIPSFRTDLMDQALIDMCFELAI